MMGMQTMQVPDIRWSVLKSEFDAKTFRLAVTQGQDPDGEKQVNRDIAVFTLVKYGQGA